MKRQRIRSSFRTAFCFSWLGIKEKSVFSVVLFSYGHSFPHPLFQQETERSPRSKSEGGSLAEKVIIVTNVPVLQCGQRCSNVPFGGWAIAVSRPIGVAVWVASPASTYRSICRNAVCVQNPAAGFRRKAEQVMQSKTADKFLVLQDHYAFSPIFAIILVTESHRAAFN